MATNPMRRKARNSFLLGIVVTLLITGAVIAFLILQLKNYKDKEAEEKANSTKVWVLSENVISGQIITTDMLTQQVTNKNLVPSNAIGDMSILSNYALTDKEGNEIHLMDILESQEEDVPVNLEKKENTLRLYQCMEQHLTPQEKEILILRYGLYGQKPTTQRVIAKRLGISRSYVSRIEKNSVLKLRHFLLPT